MTDKAITTTLKAIRRHSPCEDGWERLLKHLGKTKADDEPLKFSTILESNGLDDALWCLRSLPEEHHPRIRHLAADYAERVLHIYEDKYPSDNRPRKAIEAARKFADGEISQEELDAAVRDAAGAAYWAAGAAVRDAAGAARDAARAAWHAARAAWHAAGAAGAAYWAAGAAYWAALAAAGDAGAALAARAAEEEMQAELLIKYLG